MAPELASGSAHEVSRFCVRGVNVAAIDIVRATDLIRSLAVSAPGSYVTVTGAHGIVESAYSETVRDAHRQAALVVPDGMPVVWLGRLLGFKSIGRVYGPDLMESVFSRQELRQLRHFFYGSTPAVVEQLTTGLSSRFGEFALAGAYSPPIRPIGIIEEEPVLTKIRETRPDIIWIGLSTPKQEIWLNNHMKKIGFGVGIGVGAAFDLVAGTTLQAPRWIQRSGLEWLFRLVMEPRRLFRRYLFIIPRFSYFMLQTLATSSRQQRKQDLATR